MIKNLSVNSEEIQINKKSVHKIIGGLKKELNLQIESLPINFVSLETIKKINVEFLSHNYETDIITFDYGSDENILEAEIFISPDVAKQNSIHYKCSLEEELLRLIIHGILHLTGYDDMNENDKIIMEKREDELVKKFKSLLKENPVLL